MKQRILALSVFALGAALPVHAQKKTYAEMKREDSVKVASIPDSIKQAPKKKFPGAGEVRWSVLNEHYMAEFNILKADAKTYLAEDGDVVMQFYKSGKNAGKWHQTTIHYVTEPEITKNIPAPALKKIKNKLMELNKEEISSISIVDCSEKCINRGRAKETDPYKEEPFVSKGYWVWGKNTGAKTGGMLSFTTEGELILSVW